MASKKPRISGRLGVWELGGYSEDIIKKVVHANVDAAIRIIFGPRGMTEGHARFHLAKDGIKVELFDNEYEGLIPWDAIELDWDLEGDCMAPEEEAELRAAFDKWLTKRKRAR